MKRYASGFFVTEFLVYLALSAFIGLFMTRFLYSTTAQLRKATAQTDRIATIYAALDALAFDLERAPQDRYAWRQLQLQELAWQEGDTQIAWYLDEYTLKRSSKKYDKNKNKWKRSVSHVALEDVHAWSCKQHGDTHQVYALTVTIEGKLANGKMYTCERTISMHNEVNV